MEITITRWWLLALLVIELVVWNVLPGASGTIGVSISYGDGEYRFSGGTGPIELGFALLMIAGYIVLVYGIPAEETMPIGGVFRRFVAFWIDFIFAMSITTPALGIIPAVVEWRRTGSFQWAFMRTTPAKGDVLQAWLLLSMMSLVLVLYHVLPLQRSRPSPGTAIMGYRVVPDEGVILTIGKAVLRTLLGFVAVCCAYLGPFVARDRKRGKFWLDRVFRTRAVAL